MPREAISILGALLVTLGCAEQDDPFRYENLAKGGSTRIHDTSRSSGGRPGALTGRETSELHSGGQGITSNEPELANGGDGGARTSWKNSQPGGQGASAALQSTIQATSGGQRVLSGTLASGNGGFRASTPRNQGGIGSVTFGSDTAPRLTWSTLGFENFGGGNQRSGDAAGGVASMSGSGSPCVGPEHCPEGEYCDTDRVLAAYEGTIIGLCSPY